MLQSSDIVVISVVIIALISFGATYLLAINKIIAKQEQNSNLKETGRRREDNQPANIIEEKKRRYREFSGIALHYLNENRLFEFYNVLFNESMILESITDESTNEVQGKINAGVNGVASAATEGRNLKRQTTVYKPNKEHSLSMFLKYQRTNIDKKSVSVGIEDIPEIDSFLEEIKSRYGEVQNKHLLQELAKSASEKAIKRIETAQKWVLIEGRFKVEAHDKNYKYTFYHPVNDWLPDVNITISFEVPQNDIRDNYPTIYKNLKDGNIQLTVYGSIVQNISTTAKIWDVQLDPLAIY